MKKNYKFNPLDHGYESVEEYPELDFLSPRGGGCFIKIVAGGDECGGRLVYWFSIITLNNSGSPMDDDRVKISSSSFDWGEPASYDSQSNLTTDYYGLITSDSFAKGLLGHVFSALYNKSYKDTGVVRYKENIGLKMRKNFPQHYR